MTTILKALVGSRAYGLYREDSDWDWRGVFVQPTREILSLLNRPRTIQWLEGKEDFTNYEIGHFLMLAVKSNPSVLELLVSPQTETPTIHGRNWGAELRALFPYLYDPEDAFRAFTGYSLNQRKKLMDDKDGRKWKYALAYIRTLHNLADLLRTGEFSLAITRPERLNALERIRDGLMSVGEIVDLAETWTEFARTALCAAESRQDLGRVDDFLLDVRQAFWEAANRVGSRGR